MKVLFIGNSHTCCDPDHLHASHKGSCLSALTHYRTVFGRFPENTDTLKPSEEELRAFPETVQG